MTATEFSWTTFDNINIYAKEWKVEFPKAVVALVHGLGEHCNRYQHMADYYAQHNIATIGYDRRGHGKSGGKKGHSPNYEALLKEVDELLDQVKSRFPGIPVFLYGHSMGGNIALKYAISRQPTISGLISSGAFIEFPASPPALLIAIGKIMRKIYPAFSQSNGLSPQDVSSDPVVVEDYIKDPLVHDRITSSTAIGMIEVAKELELYKGQINIPLLIMHGNLDKLTAFQGSKKFAERIKGPVTFKEWDQAFHEIHNEPIQKDVFDYTINWIRKTI